MKWLRGITDLNELRMIYRTLALKYHPDKGGDTATMQEINNEYDILSKRLIDGNVDFSEGRKVYEREVSEELKEKISQIVTLPGVVVEIIGSWIWVTGNTRPVKDDLKEAGLKFSPKKTAWYWHCGNYRKVSKKQYDLNSIRNMWGSQKVEKEERVLI